MPSPANVSSASEAPRNTNTSATKEVVASKKNKLPRLSVANQTRALTGYALGGIADVLDSHGTTLKIRIGTVGWVRFGFGDGPQNCLKLAAYERAMTRCPAYRDHVEEYFSKYPPKDINNVKWEEIPTTDGDYIKKNQKIDRSRLFLDGKIPKKGIQFTSSGTTGNPKKFTVGQSEKSRTLKLLNTSINHYLPGEKLIANTFIPNSISAMMVDGLTETCTIIPIHDDIEALKKFILEELSPKSISEKDTRKNKFNFILTGYPSFLHNVLKDEKVRNAIRNADKSKVTISAISGGEKLSFAQRKNMNELGIDYVISSYGASDVGIGIGGQDKEREPAIEKACYENRDFCKELFGQDYPPSIFYYDPGTYDIHLVKENANAKMGELFYTVLKSDKAMTVMKYSMGDIGCFYKPDEVNKIAAKYGITLPNTHDLPMLAIEGRIRDSVAYGGPKFSAGQFEEAIDKILINGKKLSDFCSNHGLNKSEDSSGTSKVKFLLELKKGYSVTQLGDLSTLKQTIIDAMISISKDFQWGVEREGKDNLSVHIFNNNAGPIFNKDDAGKKKQLVFIGDMLNKQNKPVQPVFVSN